MTDPTPAEALRALMATKIADLKALSQKATDGAWLHYDRVFRKKFGNGRVTEIQRYGDGKAIVNWAGFDGLPDVTARKKNNNARFIVELVNFFRKHADDLSVSLATLPRPPAADAEKQRRLAEKVWNESCDAIGAMLEFHRQMAASSHPPPAELGKGAGE